MAIVMKCNKCKRTLENEYRMVLMMGPRGFRQYAVCLACASKMNLPPKRDGRRQRQARAGRTAEA